MGETRYEIDFGTHTFITTSAGERSDRPSQQQIMITHFNVAQMLVQHRLKTDPNLENQLRAASAVVR